ncbi:tetratricopeptide repeat protein [Flavobacterium ardleyense]|uniref:tetratricopeptide repeat protein n=1 Tax=Flavobacterium ardleyense TaxID=2038737 RepID=UPI00298C9955|nr:tetratricopeptide repeat protein [Flavobacterium ardleyense]
MKYLLFLLTIWVTNATAQNGLKFEKRFVQSEDAWVAFPVDSTGAFPFGFIYIDAEAGLTLDYGGTFKIDKNGKFLKEKVEEEHSIKYRLQPNNVLVALIPETNFGDLNIQAVPEWLKFYKKDQGSVEHLYRRGFLYNGYGECEKALEYLEKANKLNPNFKGLAVELAYSYNCLARYESAIKILQTALKTTPEDAYTNKELIFAQAKLEKLEDAANIFRKTSKFPDKTYNAENAYNILQGYYLLKDKKNFSKWWEETKDYISSNQQFLTNAEFMKKDLL